MFGGKVNEERIRWLRYVAPIFDLFQQWQDKFPVVNTAADVLLLVIVWFLVITLQFKHTQQNCELWLTSLKPFANCFTLACKNFQHLAINVQTHKCKSDGVKAAVRNWTFQSYKSSAAVIVTLVFSWDVYVCVPFGWDTEPSRWRVLAEAHSSLQPSACSVRPAQSAAI